MEAIPNEKTYCAPNRISDYYQIVTISSHHLSYKSGALLEARKTASHVRHSALFRFIVNSSLARKKIPEYYSCRCRNTGSDVH